MISSIGRPVTHLNGYAPTLPTPFDENEALDVRAFGQTCELPSPPTASQPRERADALARL
jgi:hypothetical protein